MFISRLILNPCNAQVRSELVRPYEIHRTLSKAFRQGVFNKEREKDDAAGVLFRVDEKPCENLITILVQSRLAPDWSFLNYVSDARRQPYLLPAERVPDGKPNPATTELDFAKKLAARQMLAFRLRANPTKRLGKSAGDDQGKRVGIYGEKKQLEWLQRKAEAGGFRILRAMVSQDEKIEDKPKHESTRPALELLSVQFDGILKVENVELACRTVAQGIGSGKGFGFGLLSLAPYRG